MYEIQMRSEKENRQLESQKKKYLATAPHLEQVEAAALIRTEYMRWPGNIKASGDRWEGARERRKSQPHIKQKGSFHSAQT